MTDMTATEVRMRQIIKPLQAQVDKVIDHTATHLGKIETQTKSTSDVLEQLSKDFLESHESLEEGIKNLRNAGFSDMEQTNDHLRMLNLRLEVLESVPELPTTQSRSAIYTALAAAQVEINNAVTKTKNEFTNKDYADLASVLNAVRPHLSANGIALFQITEDQSASILGIRTVLAHGESGQTIEDVITMSPPKLDPQGIGSCRTYMRRYAILALCGIAGAADDDAERTKAKISPSEVEKILFTADELFEEHADDAVDLMLKNVFGGSDAKVIGNIPAGEMESALTYLSNAKAKRDKQIAAAKKAEKAAAKKAGEEK